MRQEYTSRETRNKFVSERFGEYLKGRVVNIGGGGKKHLSKYINPSEYLELDIEGEPDFKINLETEYPISIDSNQFDAVVCTDVLEHLEQFHRVFDELLRISNKYVIISVPNALPFFTKYLFRRKATELKSKNELEYGVFCKFYGLPLEKPLDRHRWHFSYTEARRYFRHHSKLKNYTIIEEFPVGMNSDGFLGLIIRKLVRLIFGADVELDFFAKVYWCLIEKKDLKP
jgi:predicted SAM-dependent methyltransferase